MSTQYAFGSGSLWAIPGVTNPTPCIFGAVQQVGIDFNSNIVNLFGAYQFPLASARGTVKIDGSGKFAQLSGKMLNNIFFSNSSIATGMTKVANLEAGSVPAVSGPYTITVTNSATWVTDLGVLDALTGDPLTRVASAPSTGQYSVTAGVYTFAAADTLKAVLISYTYTAVTGETLTITNALMGVAPAFKAIFNQSYNAQQMTLTLNQAIAAKVNFQSALEDFLKPDFSFGAFSDSANVIGYWSFADAG